MPSVLHQQAVERIHLYIREALANILEHLEPFCNGEHRRFRAIDHDCDRNLIEHPSRALDDIQVPVGHRIEASRNDRIRHIQLTWANSNPYLLESTARFNSV